MQQATVGSSLEGRARPLPSAFRIQTEEIPPSLLLRSTSRSGRSASHPPTCLPADELRPHGPHAIERLTLRTRRTELIASSFTAAAAACFHRGPVLSCSRSRRARSLPPRLSAPTQRQRFRRSRADRSANQFSRNEGSRIVSLVACFPAFF